MIAMQKVPIPQMQTTTEARKVDLILASASIARRQLLAAAEVTCRVVPANLDEEAIRSGLQQTSAAHHPPDIATRLAHAKAEHVSREHQSALVVGADQVLALGDEIFQKPTGIGDAREMLLRLRGKTHQLHSAVVLATAGEVLWTHLDTAELTMREFSTAFLDGYLLRAGARICNSVGGYELEGLGIQLFERIAGDYFTILGLPLIPLLAELRARGILMA